MAFEGFLGKAGLTELIKKIKRRFEADETQITTNKNNITNLQTRTTNLETRTTNLEVTVNGTTGQPSMEDKLTSYADAQDFLNLAPKIGRYQEDQVQVTASYSISNMPYAAGMAPSVTSDGYGREVMYFIGDGGGPKKVGVDVNYGLHKGYYDDANLEWSFYNTDIIPKCFESKTNLVFQRIYGCDNNYLIVKVSENGTTKFYRIITNNDFNEEKWVKCQDLTTAFVHPGASDRIPGPTEDKRYDDIIHAKYISARGSLVIIYRLAAAPDIKTNNWYYLTIWKCSGTTTLTDSHFVYGTEFSGPGPCIKLASGYTLDQGVNGKVKPSQSTQAKINADSAGSPEMSCTSFIFETKNTIAINIVHARFPVYKDNTGTMSRPGFEIAMSYTVSPSNGLSGFFSTKTNITRTITMNQTYGDYLFNPGYTATATAPYPSQFRNDLNTLNNGKSIVSGINASSYDTLNSRAYAAGTNQNKEITIRQKLLSAQLNDNSKLNGLSINSNNIRTLYLPDGSLWGKALGHGVILWDKTYIGCKDSNSFYLLKVDEWKFVSSDDFENDLFIEPKPGKYTKITKANFTDKLNADPVADSRIVTRSDLFDANSMPHDSWTQINGFTSVKRSSTADAEYYKAQYDTQNKKIVWRQFLPDQDYTAIKYKDTTDKTLTVSELTKEKFNTGDDDETYIYPGFVAYNPLASMFFIWGMTYESSSTDEQVTRNLKIPHVVGIKASDGEVVQFNNPSGTASEPSDYEWKIHRFSTYSALPNPGIKDRYYYVTGTGKTYKCTQSGDSLVYTELTSAQVGALSFTNKYPSVISSSSNYTPLLPYGCTVLSKTQMIVFFNCSYPGNSYSLYSLVYTFSSDLTTLQSVTMFNDSSLGGISHFDLYNTPGCAKMLVYYSGPNYGFCGTGLTRPEARDYRIDNYRVDIRTQFPLLGTRTEQEQSYTVADMLEDYVGATNTYSMFNQSASGLVAQIPSFDIFLGGYYTKVTSGTDDTRVILAANESNYIYAERAKKSDGTGYDRDKIKFKKETDTPILTPGTPAFDKILLAKIVTDADKPISTKIYTINTGYNSWKFQSFNDGYDRLVEL